MDEKLQKEITEKEEEHKKYLFLYHLGDFLKDTFKRDAIEEQPIRRAFFFLVWIVLLYSITKDILFTLIGFVVTAIIIVIAGKKLYKMYTAKLQNLKTQCDILYNGFFDEQQKQNGIRYEEIAFPDGIRVGNGYARATMRKKYGDITICQLIDYDEGTAFYTYVANRGKKGTINDKIASVEFNEKFGIIPNCSELICMKYLSPTVQLGMLNAKTIKKFSRIHVYEDVISFKTSYRIKYPTQIDIFSKKHLKKYFNEIEKYCKEMREMADVVYADLLPLDFMRGREI